MKTNYIPAIVMLSAGFLDCIFAIRQHLDLLTFTKQLLIVLVVFLLIGTVIKIVVDKCIVVLADKKEEPQPEAEGETEEDKDPKDIERQE